MTWFVLDPVRSANVVDVAASPVDVLVLPQNDRLTCAERTKQLLPGTLLVVLSIGCPRSIRSTRRLAD
jgi:hypothetical protein